MYEVATRESREALFNLKDLAGCRYQKSLHSLHAHCTHVYLKPPRVEKSPIKDGL